ATSNFACCAARSFRSSRSFHPTAARRTRTMARSAPRYHLGGRSRTPNEANAMSHVGQARATLDDLYRTPGKAELIGGRIVEHMATGYKPSLVGFRIAMSLHEHSQKVQQGVALPDNVGFAVPQLPS